MGPTHLQEFGDQQKNDCTGDVTKAKIWGHPTGFFFFFNWMKGSCEQGIHTVHCYFFSNQSRVWHTSKARYTKLVKPTQRTDSWTNLNMNLFDPFLSEQSWYILTRSLFLRKTRVRCKLAFVTIYWALTLHESVEHILLNPHNNLLKVTQSLLPYLEENWI